MGKLVIFLFLSGCTTFGSKYLQGFHGIPGRGLASVGPADLFCKRLRVSSERKKGCSQMVRSQKISDSVLSICANLETSPEQKLVCAETVAGKDINGAVVSACANWQASPSQTISFLGAVAGKDISGFVVTMCEKLWKTAQQRINCVLDSIASGSATEGSHQKGKQLL